MCIFIDGWLFFFFFTFLRYWLKITLHPCCPLLTLLCPLPVFHFPNRCVCAHMCKREGRWWLYKVLIWSFSSTFLSFWPNLIHTSINVFKMCFVYTYWQFIYFCIFMQSPVSNKLNLLHICLTFEVRSPFHNTSLYFLNLWTASPFIPWPLRFCFCASDQVSQF